jgi:alkanesulfonate monooxygenase SsuD/methylene tetrahydromethanopterin reductase-like flavin-dependent oxidoreductase (luciferase family)
MGGMGAQEMNFHNQVFVRMGYEALAKEVQELFLSGRKDQASALIPDELIEDMHIIGTEGEVKEKVAQWESTGVTTLMVSLHTPDEVRRVAELLA